MAVYSYFEKGCRQKCARDNPEVNMGYDQYTVPVTVAVQTSCFPLACANIRPLPLMPFFQISLKNGELKTTHNTFRDCRVLFFRQLSRNRCI